MAEGGGLGSHKVPASAKDTKYKVPAADKSAKDPKETPAPATSPSPVAISPQSQSKEKLGMRVTVYCEVDESKGKGPAKATTEDNDEFKQLKPAADSKEKQEEALQKVTKSLPKEKKKVCPEFVDDDGKAAKMVERDKEGKAAAEQFLSSMLAVASVAHRSKGQPSPASNRSEMTPSEVDRNNILKAHEFADVAEKVDTPTSALQKTVLPPGHTSQDELIAPKHIIDSLRALPPGSAETDHLSPKGGILKKRGSSGSLKEKRVIFPATDVVKKVDSIPQKDECRSGASWNKRELHFDYQEPDDKESNREETMKKPPPAELAKPKSVPISTSTKGHVSIRVQYLEPCTVDTGIEEVFFTKTTCKYPEPWKVFKVGGLLGGSETVKLTVKSDSHANMEVTLDDGLKVAALKERVAHVFGSPKSFDLFFKVGKRGAATKDLRLEDDRYIASYSIKTGDTMRVKPKASQVAGFQPFVSQ